MVYDHDVFVFRLMDESFLRVRFSFHPDLFGIPLTSHLSSPVVGTLGLLPLLGVSRSVEVRYRVCPFHTPLLVSLSLVPLLRWMRGHNTPNLSWRRGQEGTVLEKGRATVRGRTLRGRDYQRHRHETSMSSRAESSFLRWTRGRVFPRRVTGLGE